MAIGPTMTSAFLQPTTTGFSPVAPISAPALSIADVAIELVPTAVISTSLQLFFIAVTSCLPIPPPCPSMTRIFIK